ncbi:phytase [Flavobacterium sandaracinum]|uniref:Phytase n=1 Tax=Flavobacterium sandaracinum TaxID=2541733 RepID=A0A4R5D610_9FLAO|nr:phytase [Flavobacterium sandaracinum]TDE07051.1 phytase [Flavobacterium sandaracinum]
MKNHIIGLLVLGIFTISCSDKLAPLQKDALPATVVTQPLPHDTDDPAIWIHPTDATKSVIIGTDKDTDGGLYMYDLEGTILKKSISLKRPNNVDIAYGLKIGKSTIDVAVTTERETNKIRIFSMPDLEPIDMGGIDVFVGETERDPMGIALYTRSSDGAIFAIVGRKFGPSGTYLWQYQLKGTENGTVGAELVRKFGNFSGKKEIEAIAVDNELGFIYCSDENVGIRKYYADPAKNDNTELALFGQKDFKSDHEGIAIYKKTPTTGYILVSNQQANTFVVFAREGTAENPNLHLKLAEVSTSTIECDGADATAVNLGPQFPKGMFVAMSNGMTFHYYNWEDIQKRIDSGK